MIDRELIVDASIIAVALTIIFVAIAFAGGSNDYMEVCKNSTIQVTSLAECEVDTHCSLTPRERRRMDELYKEGILACGIVDAERNWEDDHQEQGRSEPPIEPPIPSNPRLHREDEIGT